MPWTRQAIIRASDKTVSAWKEWALTQPMGLCVLAKVHKDVGLWSCRLKTFFSGAQVFDWKNDNIPSRDVKHPDK